MRLVTDRLPIGPPSYAAVTLDPSTQTARYTAGQVSRTPRYEGNLNLNPQEGIWSLVKREIGNLAAADLTHVTQAVKRKLKQIQYRPDVVDGCLAGAGLTIND
jgi:hypothetical protein